MESRISSVDYPKLKNFLKIFSKLPRIDGLDWLVLLEGISDPIQQQILGDLQELTVPYIFSPVRH